MLVATPGIARAAENPAWVARHGLTGADYQSEFNRWTGAGYRLTSVSGYEENGDARYAAIWRKLPGPAWQARHGLTSQQYQATFDERWFTAARSLVDTILARFGDPAGGFFDTPSDGEALVVRPRGLQDNATPSGGAMAATVLLRLAALTGDGRYRQAAEAALTGLEPYLARYPTGPFRNLARQISTEP